MKLLYKDITASTQVATQTCYLVGIETCGGSSNASIDIYDEDDSSNAADRLVASTKCSSWDRMKITMFPLPGIKCEGLYVLVNTGWGTIYYYY